MKNTSFRKSIAIFLTAVLFITLTSCNRGTGCPNNFSIKSLAKVVSIF